MLLALVAFGARAGAEPRDQRLDVRLAAGVDGAYPAAAFFGIGVGLSWKYVAAELAAHTSPGINVSSNSGQHAMLGARYDVVSRAHWSFGVTALVGYRHYAREPSEGVNAAIHAIVSSIGLESVWWRSANFGLELRLAGRYTVPEAWDEAKFTQEPDAAIGFELSGGLVFRR